jgi:hypothetical protein
MKAAPGCAAICFLFGLLLECEYGGNMFLRNTDELQVIDSITLQITTLDWLGQKTGPRHAFKSWTGQDTVSPELKSMNSLCLSEWIKEGLALHKMQTN